MKKTIILTTAILLAISASAERRTMKDCTENWLQRGNIAIAASDETTLTIYYIGPAPDAPTVAPVGEGIFVLTALAGIYALSRKRKQIK